MTDYYNDHLKARIYGEAREELKSIRGQSLTKAQVNKLFKTHYDEGKDALDQLFKEGLILTETPRSYRVASKISSNNEDLLDRNIDVVRNSIQRAADEIKTIVLCEAQTLSSDFPTMKFIVRDENKGKRKNRDERLVERELPAVFLARGKFPHEGETVILTTAGMFLCLTAHRSELPDWDGRSETPLLWIQYGELALEKLAKYKR